MVLSVQLHDMEEKSSSEEFGATLTRGAGCFLMLVQFYILNSLFVTTRRKLWRQPRKPAKVNIIFKKKPAFVQLVTGVAVADPEAGGRET